MKCSVFIACSVDGFIAREDGGIDWLINYNDETGEQYGYKSFFSKIDYLVMGRSTFDLVSTFPQWPYGEKKVVVLSSRYPFEMMRINDTCEGTSLPPSQIVGVLSTRGARFLYIDGGKCIQSFVSEGLINEMIITRIPVLLGTGTPLFGSFRKDIKLKHLGTKAFPDGLVQTKYEL